MHRYSAKQVRAISNRVNIMMKPRHFVPSGTHFVKLDFSAVVADDLQHFLDFIDKA